MTHVVQPRAGVVHFKDEPEKLVTKILMFSIFCTGQKYLLFDFKELQKRLFFVQAKEGMSAQRKFPLPPNLPPQLSTGFVDSFSLVHSAIRLQAHQRIISQPHARADI
ncbi:hypothetical protein [Roseobacter sp. AzwK-3b]|uniref:hypothetical protein n=1 Tax=Roseobacter sp. AzwK-3b TaxID=351016 RepID=UPI0012F4B2AF|nr:hypothetical protein [Roseobacter sp. AzwK-3b]